MSDCTGAYAGIGWDLQFPKVNVAGLTGSGESALSTSSSIHVDQRVKFPAFITGFPDIYFSQINKISDNLKIKTNEPFIDNLLGAFKNCVQICMHVVLRVPAPHRQHR